MLWRLFQNALFNGVPARVAGPGSRFGWIGRVFTNCCVVLDVHFFFVGLERVLPRWWRFIRATTGSLV